MNQPSDAGDCIFGLILIAVTFALGYGAMGVLFAHAAIASGLR